MMFMEFLWSVYDGVFEVFLVVLMRDSYDWEMTLSSDTIWFFIYWSGGLQCENGEPAAIDACGDQRAHTICGFATECILV